MFDERTRALRQYFRSPSTQQLGLRAGAMNYLPNYSRFKHSHPSYERQERTDRFKPPAEAKPKAAGNSGSRGKLPVVQNSPSWARLPQMTMESTSNQEEFNALQKKLNELEEKIVVIKKNIEQNRAKRKHRSSADARAPAHSEAKPKASTKEVLGSLLTQFTAKNTANNDLEEDPYLSRKGSLYYISQLVRAVLHQPKLQLVRDHISQSLDYLQSLKLVRRPSDQQISQLGEGIGPSKTGRMTVVFDLDQTLIHCNDSTDRPHDMLVQITLPSGENVEAGVNVRPWAKQILKELKQKYQLVVFTAGHSCYASKIIDMLQAEEQFFEHRLYRDKCYNSPEGFYIKDLRVLGRDLSRVVLVDNAVYSYYFQPQNGIPIVPYYEGRNDYELKHLAEYLHRLSEAQDLRKLNSSLLRLAEFQNYVEPTKLVRELFSDEVVKQSV